MHVFRILSNLNINAKIQIFFLCFASFTLQANSIIVSDLGEPSEVQKWSVDSQDVASIEYVTDHLRFFGNYGFQAQSILAIEDDWNVSTLGAVTIEIEGDGKDYVLYLEERPTEDCDCGDFKIFGKKISTVAGTKRTLRIKFSSFKLVEPRVVTGPGVIDESIIQRLYFSPQTKLYENEDENKFLDEAFQLKIFKISFSD